MLDTAAFTDLRQYIKRRLAYARYRVGSTFYRVDISEIEITSTGIIRAKLSIVPGQTATVTRVELYNTDNQLWAHQDCSITVSAGEVGILYWFDFTVKEE